jgi:uncharacterized protein YcbK (DUF882 family)
VIKVEEQLTPNFNITEWMCHDGCGVPYDLVENVRQCATNLQVLRDELGRAIVIVSGYRNPSYNQRIGGAKKSFHMTGLAADIRIRGLEPMVVASTIERLIKNGKMEQGGIGTYDEDGFTHFDCRGTRARWKG